MRVKLEKLTKYFQEKQKLLAVVMVLFSFFLFAFLLSPRFAHAQFVGTVIKYTPFGWLANIASDAIGEYAAGLYLGMAESMFKGGIWAVNVAISFTSSFINNSV